MLRACGALEIIGGVDGIPQRHRGDVDDFLCCYFLTAARASDGRAPRLIAFVAEALREFLIGFEAPFDADLPSTSATTSSRPAALTGALMDVHRRLRANPATTWRPADGVAVAGLVVVGRTALLFGAGAGRVAVLRRGRIGLELERHGLASRTDLGSAPPLGRVQVDVQEFELDVGDVVVLLPPALAHIPDTDIVERGAGFSPAVAAAELCALGSRANSKECGCIVVSIQADDDT